MKKKTWLLAVAAVAFAGMAIVCVALLLRAPDERDEFVFLRNSTLTHMSVLGGPEAGDSTFSVMYVLALPYEQALSRVGPELAKAGWKKESHSSISSRYSLGSRQFHVIGELEPDSTGNPHQLFKAGTTTIIISKPASLADKIRTELFWRQKPPEPEDVDVDISDLSFLDGATLLGKGNAFGTQAGRVKIEEAYRIDAPYADVIGRAKPELEKRGWEQYRNIDGWSAFSKGASTLFLTRMDSSNSSEPREWTQATLMRPASTLERLRYGGF